MVNLNNLFNFAFHVLFPSVYDKGSAVLCKVGNTYFYDKRNPKETKETFKLISRK